MTKERRAEVENTFHSPASLFAELLAEVDFWKNAVKATNPYNPADKYGEVGCAFCRSFGELHKTDCAWALAQ